jgi:periplasmic divalent cation tolerance protein
MSEYVIVFVTTGCVEEAKQIAEVLVDQQLVACVNIMPEILSIYHWQGKVEKDIEAKMIIKTKSSLINQLIQTVKNMHSYDVCEVTAVPIISGNSDYLKWIDESVHER